MCSVGQCTNFIQSTGCPEKNYVEILIGTTLKISGHPVYIYT